MVSINLLASYAAETDDGYLYEDVWTGYAKDALNSVMLWLVIGFLAVALVVGIFVKIKKPGFLPTFVKFAVAFAAGLAVVIIAVMLSLEFLDMSESGYIFQLLLIPSVITAGVIVAGAACTYICSLFSKKAFRISLIATLSALAAAVIALIVCIAVYYSSGAAADNNGADQSLINDAGLYISAAVLIAGILLLTFFLGRNDRKGFDTRTIAYAAVCIAMSFALSYISIVKMPYGGSITPASLLPLMLFSYMFGVRKGVFAGLIYGLLQAIQDPWILHPAQFILDYPVAFAAIGLAGMFRNVAAFKNKPQLAFALGALAASVLRFIAHLFSGVFAFGQFAEWYGFESGWVYSLCYNAMYVFPDIAIAIVAGIIVLSSKSFLAQINKYNRPVTKKETNPPAPEAAAPQPEQDFAGAAGEQADSVPDETKKE